jgi:NADPH2:quinone reductase
VLGTVGSPDELAYASDLGYDDVFVHDGFAEAVRDYTQGRGVDIVLDPVGGPSPFGRVVGFDGKRQPDWEWTHAALELLAADRIRLDISSVLSLQDAALAHERLESGTSTGKILLRVD